MHETQKQAEPSASVCPACAAPLHGRPVFCPRCGLPLAAMTGQLPADRLLAGRYRVVRLLARGGMGAVYLAEDTRLAGAQVAVKEMSSAFTRGDTGAFERALADFEREAAMLARLRHAHLPRVSDRFEEDGKHFLVMEYIHGQTLRDLIGRSGGRLPLAQALDFTEQLCDVLTYLHGQAPPIIYRDLKPANVMVVSAEQARAERPQLILIDFGIARFYRPGLNSDTAVYGTIGYAPPEQYGRGQTDARTDIYALGVLLHTMLTGHDPSTTPFALPAPRALGPAIPAAVAAAIERATANDRDTRFADIAAFRAALLAPEPALLRVATPTQANARPATARVAPSQPVAQRRGVAGWLAGLLGVLLLGVLLVFVLVRTRAPSAPAPTAAAVAVATAAGEQATPDATPELLIAAATPQQVATAAPGAPTPPPEPAIVAPASASASSTSAPGIDGQGNQVTYEPARAIDRQNDTAWRVEGDGAGQWLQIDFAAEVNVQKIGLIAGYDKIDPFDGSDRFAQNRVVKRVRLEFSGGEAIEASFAQDRKLQFVVLTAPVRARSVRLVILETYPPPPEAEGGRDFTPISEVVVEGQ